MKPLNLPPIDTPLRQNEGRRPEIWDPVRKKFVRLTPEEWVRQHFLHFLVRDRHYPLSLIGIEVPMKYNGLPGRSDLVAYTNQGKPLVVVECKSFNVELSQEVIDQAARYNTAFTGRYLVITNGMVHYICELDPGTRTWTFLSDIPDYQKSVNS